MHPQTQIIPFPGQSVTPQNIPGTGLVLPQFPSFPLLAGLVDRIAKQVPWYVWLPMGMFVMFKLLSRRPR